MELPDQDSDAVIVTDPDLVRVDDTVNDSEGVFVDDWDPEYVGLALNDAEAVADLDDEDDKELDRLCDCVLLMLLVPVAEAEELVVREALLVAVLDTVEDTLPENVELPEAETVRLPDRERVGLLVLVPDADDVRVAECDILREIVNVAVTLTEPDSDDVIESEPLKLLESDDVEE